MRTDKIMNQFLCFNFGCFLPLLITMVPASSSFAQAPDFQTPNASVSAFVKDRLLYKPRNLTTKWPGVPKLEITSNSPAMKIYVEQTFLSLCQAAGLTTPGEGTYHVFIGSKEEFSKLKNIKHVRPSHHMTGWYYWIGGHYLVETITINDPSRYQDASLLQRDVFHNMLKTFGVMFDDSRFPKKSPFVPGFEFETQLSPIERLLIAFNYQHVPPGSTSSELPKLLRQYWNK